MERLTLARLRRMQPALNMAWAARRLGISRQALSGRLRRDSPELSREESARLLRALKSKGLHVVENDTSR